MNTVEVQKRCPPFLSFMLQLNCKDRTSLPGEQANGNLCLRKEISAACSVLLCRDRTHMDIEFLLCRSQSTKNTT